MANSLYTQAVRQFINSRDWPSGLVMEVRENTEPGPHLNLVFFRDNWLTMDFEDHQKITTIVKDIMAKLWGEGIPTYVGKMESIYYDKEGEDE